MPPAGASLRVGAPGVRVHEQAGRRVLLAVAMRDRAEPAVVDPRLQFAHARDESGADRRRRARCRPAPPRRAPRAALRAVEGERLFHEDVLAGGGGALDLRRRARCAASRTRPRRSPGRRGSRRGCPSARCRARRRTPRPWLRVRVCPAVKRNRVALALHRADQGPPPPPDSDNRRPDHAFLPPQCRTMFYTGARLRSDTAIRPRDVPGA